VKMTPIIMPGDGRGSFEQYDTALKAMQNPDNLPLLVCCARGTHRTGAMVACYRVLDQKWEQEEAFKEMENYRFRPRPHRYKGGEHPLLPHLREYFCSRIPLKDKNQKRT
jgi:protein-tyrosine phosphatase